MKKILISILIVLLLILTSVVLTKGINLGIIKIDSIKDIKEKSAKLDQDLNKANEISNKTYPNEVEGLEEAIRKLKISKQEYENKKINSTDDNALGTVEIKTYAIHYLWAVLGNYRKDRGVKTLNIDLKSTQNSDVYNLEFTLVGSYTSITEFLYDIENDEELKFEIKNFGISSEITSQTNKENTTDSNEQNNTTTSNNILSNDRNNQNTSSQKTTQKSDGTILQATFIVEDVGIILE